MKKEKDVMHMKNRTKTLVTVLETLSGNVVGSAMLANAVHINLYL